MSSAARRVRASDGFTLIELLAAIVLLTIGLLSLTTVLATTNSESSTAETQQTEIHIAQKEIERIAQMKFGDIVLASAPTTSTNANNPDYYVSSSGCSTTFQWDRTTSANRDTLAIQGCTDPNGIGTGPTLNSAQPIAHTQTWSSAAGRLTGTVYDYVTWISDSRCLLNVPPILNCPKYKRVTVAVTNNMGGFPKQPILISSIINDPRATLVGSILNGNPNPLDNPSITCVNALGITVTCTNSVGNLTPNTWYLTDSAESAVTYTAPTADNATHYTTAPSNATLCTLLTALGCPVPDLLNTSPPPSSITHEYNFSNEQTGTYAGGRVLNQDVACGSTPSSSDRSKGEFWATKPLLAALTLTGKGGLTLNTQTVNGTAASVTLCVAVYDLTALNVANMINNAPTPLGILSYTLAQWPTSSQPVSFSFNFLSSGTHVVPIGDSIGVRIWIANTSGAPIAVQYDAPSVASTVELDSQ